MRNKEIHQLIYNNKYKIKEKQKILFQFKLYSLKLTIISTQNMQANKTKDADENIGSGQSFFRKTSQQQVVKNQRQRNWKDIVKKVLISIPYQIAITILTVYSLVGDDIRISFFEKNVDPGFDYMNIVLMIIFSLEIVLSSIVIDNYFCSFFFTLDIISTISLLFDISMFTDLIYSSNSTNTYSFSKVAAQSKASRAAIRAVRIVKLFRIIRIVKLYKAAMKAQQIKQRRAKELFLKQKIKNKFDTIKQSDENTLGKMVEGYEDKINIPKKMICNGNDKKIYPEEILESTPSPKFNFPHLSQDTVVEQSFERKLSNEEVNQLVDTQLLQQIEKKQSKIRKIMGQITLKKVIIVVLMLMMLAPLFDPEIYLDQANSMDYTINNINYLLKKPSDISITDINTIINQVLDDHKQQKYYLIYFATPFNQLPIFKHDDFYNTRISDFVVSSIDISTSQIMALRPTLTLRTDFTDDSQRTSIICMLNQYDYTSYQGYLSMGRTLFICLLLIGLLHFFNNDIEALIVQPIQKMMDKLKIMAEDPETTSKQEIDQNAQYQTTIVSNAIIKIGALLSIVFGSAGAEIIGKNIVQQGDMNPMLQGRKKCAIFGFCDIRKFTQINQILEEDILQFVNKISSVVHKAVYRYGGSANKNIGQAFLLVWKIPENDYSIKNENNEITWHNKSYLSILADFSVYSFVKTLIKINKLPQILEYRKDYRLLQKLPNYKVEMGFGLHIGWAIEGAIGSQYKIDASYLSPNVNMASRLEAATKQFGVNFLISQNLYDVLTPGLQGYFRNIDRVTVKGSNKPLKLYTIDMNLDNISPPADKAIKYPNIPDYQPDIELKRDINMQFLQPEEINNYDADNFIKSKKQFRQVLVNAVSTDFRKRFDEGLKAYLNGKWADAKLHFTHAQKIRSNDGPTKRLLSYMKNFDFVAPSTWNNYRQLTSK